MSLKTYIGLTWVMYAFVRRTGTTTFTLEPLLDFLSPTSITRGETECFLEMISLNREGLKEKYMSFRIREEGSCFTYDERMSFDRGLPKISHFYPLLKTGDTYQYISHNSYREFMKMRSIYRTMTEDFTDINFKSKYTGPLFEDYTRGILAQYNDECGLDGGVYGDEEYVVGRDKFSDPDAILETEDYIVIIECKTTPFSLNLLRYSDSNYLRILKEGIDKSTKNIDERFLVHRYTSTEKQIVRILVFYEANHMLFSILGDDISPMIKADEFFVMDIHTLEPMLSEYTQPIPDLLSEYKDLPRWSTNLNGFVSEKLRGDKGEAKDEEIMKEIVAEMGLVVSSP